jgi:Fe(3+) dicitrate transport protein
MRLTLVKLKATALEASASANLLEHVAETAVEMPLKVAYTLQQSKFKENFSDSLFGLVEEGDEIPYIPENQLYAGIGLKYQDWQVQFSGHYVDEMLAYAGDAASKANTKTDDHFVFDLHSEVAITENVSLFGTIENLFDEEYVVARRPAGARPGQPRVGFAGIKIDL